MSDPTPTTETATASAPQPTATDADGKSVPGPENAPSSEPHPNAPPESPKTEAPKVEASAKPTAPRVPLPFEPSNFDEMWRWATWGASTRFVAKEVRGSPADVMFLLMMGRRWGLDIISSLQLYVIDGKPCLPAAFMVGLIQRSPLCIYFDPIESTMTHAVWATKRMGKGGREPDREIKGEYTIEEADMMGLLSKGRTEESAARNQWNRQPRTMLRWRAATTLGRLVYADLLAGLYSVEEMVDVVEARGDKVEIVEVPRADIENAARAETIVRDLRLPETTDDTPEEMKRAMQPPAQPAPQRQPEPVPAKGATSRIRERAQAAKRPEPSLDSLFPGAQGMPESGPLPSCGQCGVPVAPGEKLCPACKSS